MEQEEVRQWELIKTRQEVEKALEAWREELRREEETNLMEQSEKFQRNIEEKIREANRVAQLQIEIERLNQAKQAEATKYRRWEEWYQEAYDTVAQHRPHKSQSTPAKENKNRSQLHGLSGYALSGSIAIQLTLQESSKEEKELIDMIYSTVTSSNNRKQLVTEITKQLQQSRSSMFYLLRRWNDAYYHKTSPDGLCGWRVSRQVEQR